MQASVKTTEARQTLSASSVVCHLSSAAVVWNLSSALRLCWCVCVCCESVSSVLPSPLFVHLCFSSNPPTSLCVSVNAGHFVSCAVSWSARGSLCQCCQPDRDALPQYIRTVVTHQLETRRFSELFDTETVVSVCTILIGTVALRSTSFVLVPSTGLQTH